MNHPPGTAGFRSGTGGVRGSRGIRVLTAVLAGLGLSLAGVVPVGPALPASADTVTERKQALDRQLDDLRENLEGTSKALVDAAVTLKRAQSELVDANAALEVAHAAVAEATTRDRDLAGRLALAEAAVAKAGRDLEARQDEEAVTRGRLGDLAREAYVSAGLSGLSIALGAGSPDEFADRVTIAGTALRTQNGALARLGVQQADTRARQTRLSAAQSEVAALKRQSEVLVAQRQQAEQASVTAAARVSRLVAVRTRSVRVIAARKSAERKRVAALRVQQNRLAKLLRSRARARTGSSGGRAATSDNGSGRLSYPVSAPVTSSFGYRYHPILHYSRLHAGTDFGAACGTPVRAAAPGRVIRAGRAGGYGNQLVIDHGMMRGKNIATSYNHLTRFVVRSGTVRRGQVVAYSGTTGLSTGCHLHFEVYANGTHVNPMSWL